MWAGKFHDPVCELLQALYGHPQAGDLWADKLEHELVSIGFELVEGWKSVYILYPDEVETIGFVVYVDDLVMVGAHHLVETIAKLRQSIKMEEPSDMAKYLGCVHHIARKKIKGEVLTSVTFDTRKYFEASIDQYRLVCDKKLDKVITPFAPRLEGKELDALLGERGVLADHAASLIMKLLYVWRTHGRPTRQRSGCAPVVLHHEVVEGFGSPLAQGLLLSELREGSDLEGRAVQ